jgi:EmrB/QacA subfamily drug resistance transporter
MSTASGWLGVLGRERARPNRLREWPHAWLLAVGTVCFGAFMGQLDASIVTLTYRPLGVQFHASLAGVQWVSLSYLLALTALLIPVGRLADIHGRKLMYLYGFVVFTLMSALCGLAPSLGMLIGSRVVQAIGAAMLQANSVALVATSAPPQHMRAALGIQAGAQAIGLALGPTVGGLLVSTLGWRWVFGINIPVGVLGVVAGIYLLPRTQRRAPTAGLDWSGLLLLATATTSLLLGISIASGLSLPGWVAIVLLTLSAVAAVGFILRQRRAAAPLVQLAVFRTCAVRAGLLGALCGYLVLFGPLVLIPVILTDGGFSELHAGLVLTALPAGFALAAVGAERLLPCAWTDRTRATLGAAMSIAVLAGLLATPPSTGWLVTLLALLGVALGTFTPANNTLVMGAIPAQSAATGGGLVSMTRSLGTALGVALVTLALSFGISGHHILDGPHTAVLVLAAAAALILLSARLTPSGHVAARSSSRGI